VDLQEATRLAHELGLYAYDAYMIQVARRRGVTIISLDGGLCEAAGRAGGDTIKIT
jgi:predicted nucleic acid-binding protein